MENFENEVGKPFKNINGSIIGRSKFGVGKRMGSQIWVHKNYALDIIPESVLSKARSLLPVDFEYNTLMYDLKKPEIVRFDEAPNFDYAREPIPGDSITINTETGDVKASHSDMIWHHKWEWVKNDYQGFDVEESYNWSKEWASIIDNLSGIGSLRIWNARLLDYGLEPDKLSEYRENKLSIFINSNEKGYWDFSSLFESYENKAETNIDDTDLNSTFINDDHKEVIDQDGNITKSLKKQKVPSWRTSTRGNYPKGYGPEAVETINKALKKAGIDKEFFAPGTRNFEIGAGQSWRNTSEKLLSFYDVENFPTDMFWGKFDPELNRLNTVNKGNDYDTATAMNVLNVIDERDARLTAISNLAIAVSKKNGIAVMQIFPGDKTGVGQVKNKGENFQMNAKAKEYLSEVKTIFNTVILSDPFLIATDPKMNVVNYYCPNGQRISEDE